MNYLLKKDYDNKITKKQKPEYYTSEANLERNNSLLQDEINKYDHKFDIYKNNKDLINIYKSLHPDIPYKEYIKERVNKFWEND